MLRWEQGMYLFMIWGRVILTLRITRVMTLRRWGSLLLKKPYNYPLPLLLKTMLKNPQPALNRRESGSKPWLGGRISLGFESS